MYLRTFAEVNLDSVKHNIDRTKEKLKDGVKLLGVVKADAYGHGAVELARRFESDFDFFGVACIEEAAELVDAGITTPLLILGYVSPDDYGYIVKHRIRIPIFHMNDAKALSAEAVNQNAVQPFHFCVDTGMSRIGFQPNKESAELCSKIAKFDNLEAEGIFSHFATADESELSKALVQQKTFSEFCKMLSEFGVDIPIKHINNSAGIMNFEAQFNMCRMGIITYGMYPSHEVDKTLLDIKPALQWKTGISHIKTLPAGREISYGGDFVTERNTVVATIPVGYADGYPRSLSGIGEVLVCGRRAKIIGRICMDQFMVDVTDIEGAAMNSEVVLVGTQGGETLSMEEVSEKAGSFNYELPCRISRRVPRVYTKDGEVCNIVKYL
ncbi:MAG: alanine racemase [Ruminococcaceae bacterium]|nr:alanine racemase [Oscillospiraceae bacterium]